MSKPKEPNSKFTFMRGRIASSLSMLVFVWEEDKRINGAIP
jgi:hypothetical protein